MSLLRLPLLMPRLMSPARKPDRHALLAMDGLSILLRRLRHAGARLTPHRAAADQIAQRLAGPSTPSDTHRSPLDVLTRVAEQAHATLGLQAHPVQLAAAHALLCGRFVEMATGEGKTLVVGLAAAAGALSGHRVHAITANDYLVARDAATMAPLFEALGLRVGHVVTSASPQARARAYAADITYVTARELVFDALRDSVSHPRTGDALVDATRRFVHRAEVAAAVAHQDMAIIDEADSVLIDDARVPLVLSRPLESGADADALQAVMSVARACVPGEDFEQAAQRRQITLRPAGQARANALPGEPRQNALRLTQALAALHAYARDVDYLVRDAQVHIIDPQTGRLAQGRSWSQELHRFIELKEGCPLGRETCTAAQMTYQRFFPRYRHLCGISGTLVEASAELAAIYDRAVVRVPTHRPVRRTLDEWRLFDSGDAMDAACAARARQMQQAGRAVLIGTDSVAHSRRLSACLAAAGIGHRVLDAQSDADEAHIVAHAGRSGAVTVATRMAGRGTDIALDDAVRANGGLHVICAQHNPNTRIDRQMIGRCARQGDPGSAEQFRARDADALHTLGMSFASRLPDCLWMKRFRLAQWQLSTRERADRLNMLRFDQRQHRRHAYRGPGH